MATSILSIGQSALAAAQAGLSTTGHNIANASTPGYSRQVVIQGAAQPQNFGFGFMGQGTQISTVQRVYNEYLGVQVQSAQASQSGLNTYYTQIKQIDNMLADPTAGLSRPCRTSSAASRPWPRIRRTFLRARPSCRQPMRWPDASRAWPGNSMKSARASTARSSRASAASTAMPSRLRN